MLPLLACAEESATYLSADPERLDFPEVEIATGSMPEDGWAAMETTITNTGEDALTVTISSLDTELFCLGGYPDAELPLELGELPAGAFYVVQVQVCDYPPGAQGQSVEREMRVSASLGEPIVVEIQYTPVLAED
jgi:hypothetical protein